MGKENNILDFIRPRKREELNESYFENMASSIITSNKKVVVRKLTPFYKKSVFWISSSAAVFIGIVTIQSLRANFKSGLDFNSVSTTELLAYIDDNINEFDQELLIKYLPTQQSINNITENQTINKTATQSTAIQATPINTSELLENINQEDVLYYLESEELTIEDLEE